MYPHVLQFENSISKVVISKVFDVATIFEIIRLFEIFQKVAINLINLLGFPTFRLVFFLQLILLLVNAC